MPTAKEIGKEIYLAENQLKNLQERIKELRNAWGEQQLVENRQVLWHVVRRIDGEVIYGPASYNRVIHFLTDMLGMDSMHPAIPDERGAFIFTKLNKQAATHYMEPTP